MKRYMSELWDALRLGHSDGEGRGMGQRNLSIWLMKSITSMERTAQKKGYGQAQGFQTQPYYQIYEIGKFLFQNVFGGKEAKVNRCKEPNSGKGF